MRRASGSLLLIFVCGTAWAQNTVSINNAAAPFLPNPPVAPGSLVQIALYPPDNGPLTLNPDTSSLELDPAGSNAPLPMTIIASVAAGAYSAPETALIALVPANAPLGPAQMHVSLAGVDQGSGTVNVVTSSFGLYTNGPVAVADNVPPGGSTETNSLTHPARPGDYITLWGTGLGTTPASAVTVKLGGRPATVTYAGHSSEPGVDQINIQVPDDPQIPAGCYVGVEVDGPVAAQGFAQPGNQASVSLTRGSGGSCRHPLGLNFAQEQKLDSGGTIPIATVAISQYEGSQSSRVGTDFVRSDAATMTAQQYDALEAAEISGPPLTTGGRAFGCSTYSTAVLYANFIPAGRPFGGLDAGKSLTLSGPGSVTATLTQDLFFSYAFFAPAPAPVDSADAVADSFFTPGTWMLSGSGGKDLAPFSLALPAVPAVHLTNAGVLASIDSTKDLTVGWDALGYSAGETVTVLLPGVSCTAPASSGSLTIPAGSIKGVPGGQTDLQISIGPQAAASTSTSGVFSFGILDRPAAESVGQAFPLTGETVFQIHQPDGTPVPAIYTQTSSESIPVTIAAP